MSEQNLFDEDFWIQARQRGLAAQAVQPPPTPPAGHARQWETCMDPEGDPRWAATLLWGWIAFSVFSVFFMAVMLVLEVWYD